MQTPENFLSGYFSQRNALFRRFQSETEAFERAFRQDFLISDRRSKDYEGERVLEVIRDTDCVKVTTNGHYKGKIAKRRLRYILVESKDGWVISDLEFECPLCEGAIGQLLRPETLRGVSLRQERFPITYAVSNLQREGLGLL